MAPKEAMKAANGHSGAWPEAEEKREDEDTVDGGGTAVDRTAVVVGLMREVAPPVGIPPTARSRAVVAPRVRPMSADDDGGAAAILRRAFVEKTGVAEAPEPMAEAESMETAVVGIFRVTDRMVTAASVAGVIKGEENAVVVVAVVVVVVVGANPSVALGDAAANQQRMERVAVDEDRASCISR
mmetsp:Transcript_1543/g.3899  ORF Transcript_1543/g.3899 Transcript_1543/m.3899 type:complete len:184 (+) Transcript_1543:852-1403(+)